MSPLENTIDYRDKMSITDLHGKELTLKRKDVS